MDSQAAKKAALRKADADPILGRMSHSLQPADVIALSLKFSQKACGKHNWRCMTHAKMVLCFPKSILVAGSTTTRRI
ncbi:hypothetical protein [Rhizobium sp. IY2]|uniref:hypothetical protein n=1 Tax=Rhizobium sp. IY2 TaxID=3397853 RepID=UPI0039E039E8